MIRALGSALTAFLLLTACGLPGADEPDRFVVRDSADVQVAENERARWEVDDALEPEEPVLSIGVAGGPDPVLLHRVTDVLLLQGGSVAVANSGHHEVLVFGADGRLQWSVGGQGEGPGEFQGELRLAALPGDSLVAFDWLLRRMTRIDPGGRVAGVGGVPGELPNTELVGTLLDGRLVISARHLRLGPGLNQDSVSIHVLAPGGGDPELVASVRRSPVVLVVQDGGPPMVSEQPLGPSASLALASDRLYLTPGNRPEFRVLRPDGTVERIVRWNLPATPVTAQLRRRWEDWYLEQRPSWRPWLEEAEFPEWLPATASILVDPATGEVWVQRLRVPWDESARWDVFSAEGDWRETVVLPATFTPMTVSSTRIAGVGTGELGVETVEIFER